MGALSKLGGALQAGVKAGADTALADTRLANSRLQNEEMARDQQALAAAGGLSTQAGRQLAAQLILIHSFDYP